MIRIVLAIAILGYVSPAEARVIVAHPDCNVLWPCEGVTVSKRGERIVKAMGGFGSPQKVYKAKRSEATSIGGIIAPLATKAAEIVSSCGSKVISAVRHTFIAGTRHISLHASGKAVDMAGNPSCIYAHLAGWQGGYSTDYSSVSHVHISYDPDGGREMGIRFSHHRFVRRHSNHRYAGMVK